MATKISVRRRGRGCVGAVEVPMGDGSAMRLVATGDTKAEALARATTMASHIFSDPVVQAIIPPQARMAVQSAKVLAAAGGAGIRKLRGLWGRLRGANKRKLALALARDVVKAQGGSASDVAEVGAWFRRRKKKKRPQRRLREREERDDNQETLEREELHEPGVDEPIDGGAQ